jgi:CheY-like chemotaxis protein
VLDESPIVLVAEDESLVRDLIEAVLEDSGFALRLAATGREAIDALDAQRVAALVTDIDLGAGCSGWEVAAHARARDPALPVIYMSGGSAYALPDRAFLTARCWPSPSPPPCCSKCCRRSSANGGAPGADLSEPPLRSIVSIGRP